MGVEHQGLGYREGRGVLSTAGCNPSSQLGSFCSCQGGFVFFFFFLLWCLLSKQEATESIFVFPEGGVCVVFAFFLFPSSLVLCNLKSLLSCLWLRWGGGVGSAGDHQWIGMPLGGLHIPHRDLLELPYGSQGCCHLGPHSLSPTFCRHDLGAWLHLVMPCHRFVVPGPDPPHRPPSPSPI